MSFSEQTLVTTTKGQKPISEVEIGDLVLAYNELLGQVGIYPVTAVWSHLDPVVVKLVIDGQLILTTPEHPFFISGNAWVAAGDLWLGAKVKKADGSYGPVEVIEVVERPQQMYNLTVETAHTYFVGDEQWLVHNACDKLLWTSWRNYPKATHQGREYAQIGDRLYTHHAVDRMQPSDLGSPAGTVGRGRSISPTYVDLAIQEGSKRTVITKDGVERTIHTLGTVEVVTEQDGLIVVTVNSFSGGRR